MGPDFSASFISLLIQSLDSGGSFIVASLDFLLCCLLAGGERFLTWPVLESLFALLFFLFLPTRFGVGFKLGSKFLNGFVVDEGLISVSGGGGDLGSCLTLVGSYGFVVKGYCIAMSGGGGELGTCLTLGGSGRARQTAAGLTSNFWKTLDSEESGEDSCCSFGDSGGGWLKASS